MSKTFLNDVQIIIISSETWRSYFPSTVSTEYESVLRRLVQGLADSVKKYSSQGNRVSAFVTLAAAAATYQCALVWCWHEVNSPLTFISQIVISLMTETRWISALGKPPVTLIGTSTARWLNSPHSESSVGQSFMMMKPFSPHVEGKASTYQHLWEN